MNGKLGGCLIGYGLKKKDGTFKKVIFDKPIHNTITKHCLNNLLMFDGTNDLPTGNVENNYLSLFIKSSGTSNRYGVINFSALGDGVGNTYVDDTDLKHRLTTYSNIKKSGAGWSGSTINTTDAVVKLRIAHTHEITQDFTVHEIGWYNATYSDLQYTLSARVQLDTPVPVETGDIFYSIYELSIGFQDVEQFTLPIGDGYKVNGYCTYNYGNDSYNPFPLINTDGNPYTGTSYFDRYIQFVPVWSNRFSRVKSIKTDWSKFKPFLTNVNVLRNNMVSSYTIDAVENYVLDSFYRDSIITLNPSMLGSNIYGLSIDGTFFRFGTFDSSDNFIPAPITINGALKITVRQSWSTDDLQPDTLNHQGN